MRQLYGASIRAIVPRETTRLTIRTPPHLPRRPNLPQRENDLLTAATRPVFGRRPSEPIPTHIDLLPNALPALALLPSVRIARRSATIRTTHCLDALSHLSGPKRSQHRANRPGSTRVLLAQNQPLQEQYHHFLVQSEPQRARSTPIHVHHFIRCFSCL